MGLPFLLLFGGGDPPETRVTALAVEYAYAPAGGATRVSDLVVEVVRRRPAVTFPNGTSIVGLTWIELTRRDGSVLVMSRVPLDDPPSYYHGYKWPYVLSWGPIRRGSSDWLGQFTAADLRIDYTDHTGILRQIADDEDFANLYGVVRSIDDPSRRQQLTPTTVFRGPIREDSPAANLRYTMTLKDPLQERFSSNADLDQLPQRRVTQDDFPNCHTVLVRSSAWDYTVGADYTAVEDDGTPYVVVDAAHQPVTRVTVAGGYGTFAIGDRVTLAGDTSGTVYTVSGSSGTSVWNHLGRDAEIWIEVAPALQAAVASGAAITILPSHQVASSLGQAVPFWYGHLTDRHVVDDVDDGDGQGRPLYVGDRVLSDGKTYGEFLWAGHATYAPGGKPFPMLYFGNEPLEHLPNPNFLEIGDYATEAASGGRIVAPGYSNWTTLIGSTPYVDYNGRRYTTIFLRGIFRDWALDLTDGALGILGSKSNGQAFTVDGYGAETVGTGSGSLILNLFDQWLHCWRNHVLPVGGYQGGLWRTTSPTFPDDATVPMIADASFAQAKARSIARIGGVGYRGDWGCGPNNETIPVRELAARLAVSSGAEIGWTAKTQFMVDLLDDDADTTMVGAETLTDVRDIFAETFRPERVERELYSVLPYVHTRDYVGRAQGGWRSVTCADAGPTGNTTIADATAVTKFGTLKSPTLELWCLRGQNRLTDAAEYAQGTLTIADVLSHKIRRCRTTPMYVTFVTGPKGHNLELFDRIWIAHFEQLGGRTARPYRILEHHARPDEWTVELRCQDLTHILD